MDKFHWTEVSSDAQYSLHLLHAGLERLVTLVATSGELAIITVTTVDALGLRSEWLVHEGHPAFIAQEASLVPVFFCGNRESEWLVR